MVCVCAHSYGRAIEREGTCHTNMPDHGTHLDQRRAATNPMISTVNQAGDLEGGAGLAVVAVQVPHGNQPRDSIVLALACDRKEVRDEK